MSESLEVSDDSGLEKARQAAEAVMEDSQKRHRATFPVWPGIVPLMEAFDKFADSRVREVLEELRKAAQAAYDSDEEQKVVDLEGATPEAAYKNGWLAGVEAVYRCVEKEMKP